MNDNKKTQIEKKTARDEFLAPVHDAAGLSDIIVRAEQQLCVISGRALDKERVARLAVLTRMAAQRNPEILKASRESLFWACMEAARVGLEWDGEHGALVPYNNKQGDKWVTEVRFQPMVKGLVRLIAEAGVCTDVETIPVFAGDLFRVIQGTSPSIVHEPDMLGDRSDAKLIAVYAVFRLRDGTVKFDVMSRSDVDKRKAVSKAQNGPWSHWYVEMARKTILKHGIKFLPRVSVALRDAVEIDSRAEVGEIGMAREESKMLTGEVDEVKEPSTKRGTSALRAIVAKDAPPAVEEDPQAGKVETVDDEPPASAEMKAQYEAPISDATKTALLNALDATGARTPELRMKVVGVELDREVSALGGLSEAEGLRVIASLKKAVGAK